RNAEGGPMGITSTPPVAGWAGNFFVCSTNIQGRFVRQLDTTIDDGNTATGTLRVICQNECPTAPSFPANLTTAEDANLYTVCASS
ncbi:MAG: prepilin-type cleavage/methylation domain-containing protein, partial [Rhodocyclaceae bacterium]|nr:prepilin-type cleavage/methylation domain-containing protein [Rhodocyclaceae bacterium]